MTNESERAGIALLCDLNGTILKVIRDELGLVNRLVPGKPFSLVVDRGSLTKALDFLFALKADGAVFDWELGIPIGDSIKVLHFAGARSEDDLVVVGANTEEEVEQLLWEFVRMGNEQANRLRKAMKENVRLSCEKSSRESGLYDELGRLNNELSNLQRELAKKNVDLERLNEEKNRFLGMAAHDLRNPLNAIQMSQRVLTGGSNGQSGRGADGICFHHPYVQSIHAPTGERFARCGQDRSRKVGAQYGTWRLDASG